jgi:PDDEXK-like domain of unknown function (DUF3799)
VHPVSLPRRCTVCRRTGHTNRAHANLSGPELAALKADGLEYMGRGFREKGEPHPDGDLLNLAQAEAERAELAEAIAVSEQQIARAFRVPGYLLGTTAALGEQGPQFAPWRTPLGPDGPKLITLPGVYSLTAEEYHSFDVTGDWFSNSDAKKLLTSCPAQFDYDRRHGIRKTSDAFDFGHVAHAIVLGQGEQFEVFEPCKLDGRTTAGKEQKRAVDAARAAGRTPIYGDQFAVIAAMAEAIKADPLPHQLLTQPGRPEMCLFWVEHVRVTDPKNSLYGTVVEVKRRAMIDHLPDMPEDGKPVELVDYKTADEVKPDDNMRKKNYDYGYHRQADTYESAVLALFGREAVVTFLLQSKRPPHLIVPTQLDTPAMRVAAAQNHEAMQQWAECVATGVWPGHVAPNTVATSGVPAWIERQYEEEIEVG